MTKNTENLQKTKDALESGDTTSAQNIIEEGRKGQKEQKGQKGRNKAAHEGEPVQEGQSEK